VSNECDNPLYQLLVAILIEKTFESTAKAVIRQGEVRAWLDKLAEEAKCDS